MKLFRFTCGTDERIAVFADDKDAYERRTEIDETFHYLPVTIEEITVPGYEITIKPINGIEGDKQELRAWLDARNIEYVPQWGVEKLREVAKAWLANQQQ